MAQAGVTFCEDDILLSCNGCSDIVKHKMIFSLHQYIQRILLSSNNEQ